MANERRCETCKFYEDWLGICCNGLSIYAADFRDADDLCDCWEGA